MNLSPIWETFFSNSGIEAVHWSKIGAAYATDEEIFHFAGEHKYIIFTNDLDFGAILFATNASFPSVIQARTQNLTPESLGENILLCLKQFSEPLQAGCILTLDTAKSKVRLLPFR
ncbi:MAG: DUF5615 family PIN-like protein [Saprospiraceae bacterium]|nr:DUF5615 family PIN-like protein [Saprospiraceae bacterium]